MREDHLDLGPIFCLAASRCNIKFDAFSCVVLVLLKISSIIHFSKIAREAIHVRGFMGKHY